MMTNPSSLCNIISQLPNGKSMYPNYDFALDNAINFALHELIDSILSPQLTKDGWGNVIPNAYGGSSFQDAYGADAAEKCANIIMDVGKFARNANIQVAGYGFIVFPMYHYAYQDCRMQS